MTSLAPGTLLAAKIIAGFLAGAGVGLFHFGLLQKNIEILIACGSTVRAVALHAIRFIGTGTTLYFAARFGALPLLAAAAGILPARWLALRHVGGAQ